MKLFLLSAFGMCVAMSAVSPQLPSGIQQQLGMVQKIAEERASIFDEFLALASFEAQGELARLLVDPPAARKEGLQLVSLNPASLEPSSSVQSGARGLMPEAEWRRMFPHKPGYSR